MNILIICTWFRPDTAIAAKRPYMFAKYLSEFGHSVTVVRSGLINKSVDKSIDENTFKFDVISYMGKENQPAQSFTKQDIQFLPRLLYNIIIKINRYIGESVKTFKAIKTRNLHLAKIKEVLDGLDMQKFDVVFTTYGEFANVLAGRYAKENYGCKWVLDFRDRIVQPGNKSWIWNRMFDKFEKKAILDADVVTTVSEDLFNGTDVPKQKIITIYNGFESCNSHIYKKNPDKKFTICYTGSFYGYSIKAVRSLFEVLSELIKDKLIDKEHLSINYASKDSRGIMEIAASYNLQSIINDLGYLNSNAVLKVQKESDLFLVLSGNMRNHQGILTGKFYEGVQSEKPILSIVYGDTPNSELYRLNQTYHYGFCYETCRANTLMNDFKDYLLSLYNTKINGSLSYYTNNAQLVQKFDYQYLSHELENVFINLINN